MKREEKKIDDFSLCERSHSFRFERERECFGLGVWSGSTINHIVVTVCRFKDSWQFATLEWVSRGVLLLLLLKTRDFFFLNIFRAYLCMFVCVSSSHPHWIELRKKNKNFGHWYGNGCKLCLYRIREKEKKELGSSSFL